MPNWTYNTINLKNITKEKRLYTDGHFDFDKIIPEPRKKEDCPSEYYTNEKTPIQLDDEKPWFDWYKWRCDNWGTKWNCKDYYMIDNDTIEFETAWCFPYPIAIALSKRYPREIITWQFTNEDYDGDHTIILKNGMVIHEETDYDLEDFEEEEEK